MAWKQARQGELLFRVVDSLPDGLVPSEPVDGLLIVGHSETGHVHAFRKDSGIELYETPDPFTCYLRTSDIPAELDHFRVEYRHGSITFDPLKVFQVKRQRQYLFTSKPVVWLD